MRNPGDNSFFNQLVGKGIGKAGDAITIKLENPHLWSPLHPFLYKLQVGTETTTTFCNCWRFLSRLDSVLETRWTLTLVSGPSNWPRKERSRSYFSMENRWIFRLKPGLNLFHPLVPSTGSNMNSWLQFLFLESRPCPRHLYLTRFCHSCFIVEFRIFGMD